MERIEGLTAKEVEERIRDGKVNTGQEVCTKSFGEVLRTNLLTPFNFLNLALAVVVLLVGSIRNALFMGVVILNAFIGTFQELRAKHLLDRLSLITAPKATVIRDSEPVTIPLEELVLDDVMYIETGRQVGADAVLIAGECEANEALITGEQDPVSKTIGDELVSGSFIVSGPCYARVIHVGADNYAAKITSASRYFKRPESEIIDGVNKIMRFVSWVIVPLGLFSFLKNYFILGESLEGSVTSTVAGAVGMIPEGLVLLTSVALSVGAIRLGRMKALVQEMYSIETLARVDVLCLDKTGTITSGEIRLQDVRSLSDYTGEYILSAAKTLVETLEDENATAKAVLAAEGAGLKAACVNKRIPFSSSRKYSGICVHADENGEGGQAIATLPAGTWLIGSAEHIFAGNTGLCDRVREAAAAAKESGMRVLTLAHSEKQFNENAMPDGLEPVGILIFSDVVRENAAATLRFFKDEGVALKVISGDDAVTVSNIAREAGMEDWENRLDASGLRTAEDCRAAITGNTVFGRVDPWQKYEFVKALKDKDHIVAMTGDGVNDVMALKESNCGIAMAAGSDAARNVSKIVLMDSDFASMPAIVAEGRRCINNLQRSSALFLSKTLFSVFAMLFYMFASIPYPMQPIQFTLINALTIGAPSVVLALLPNNERINGNFLENVLLKAVPGAATNCVVAILTFILLGHFGITRDNVSTVMMLLVSFTNFLVLFKVCLPFNMIKTALFIAMAGAYTIAVLFFGWFFMLSDLAAKTLIVTAICCGGLIVVYSGFLLLTEKVLGRKK